VNVWPGRRREYQRHARARRAGAGLRIAGVHGDNRDKARALADRSRHDRVRLARRAARATLARSRHHRQSFGRHAEQAIAAARRGRHVLVEKPLDITTARVDALAQEVERAKITLGVIFQDR
jgi:predicted dehydrogenase